jgi:dTDP-4-amino-4,6-dideoxygalactose transaminase
MEAFMQMARRHKLFVLEDAAHAHGAADRGRPAGSLGHAASFSFQSSKNLTCGEGGLISTNDDRLAAACRSLHNCGRVPDGLWYEHHVLSGNYRLSEFQGAVLNAQLDRLEAQAETRDRNGRYLAGRLAQVPGLHPQKRPATCTRHSYHLFLLRLDAAAFGAPRAAVIEALRAEGIPCSPGYGFSLPQQPMFRQRAFGPYLAGARERLDYSQARCPNSDRLCREQAVWLEHALLLGSRADMDDIVRAFEKVHDHRAALTERSRAGRANRRKEGR